MKLEACIKQALKDEKISGDRAKEVLGELRDRRALYSSIMSPQEADALVQKEFRKSLDARYVEKKRQAGMKALKAEEFQKLADEVGPLQAAEDFFYPNADIKKVQRQNLDLQKEVITKILHGTFADGIEVLKSAFGGLKRPKALIRNVLHELYGVNTGDAAAKAAARAWNDSSELARQMYNQAGGSIPKLRDWRIPAFHDVLKVGQATAKEWADYIKPLLDMDRMFLGDGRPLSTVSDDEIQDILEGLHDPIRTDGMIDFSPGQQGKAALANKRLDHRFIFFKDSDSYLAYQKQFGTDDIYGGMIQHLNGMARDIAALQILGPNPGSMVKYMTDAIQQAATVSGEGVPNLIPGYNRLQRIEDSWQHYQGLLSNPNNHGFAAFASGVRDTLTSIQLGSAIVSALPTDPFFQAMTRHINGIPITRMLGDYMTYLFSKESKAFANRIGVIAENWTTVGLGAVRYYGEFTGPKATRVLADGTMQLSGLSAFTQAGRQGFQMAILGELAEDAGKAFKELSPERQASMTRYGIDEQDWNIIRKKAKAELKPGAEFVDPLALYRTDPDQAMKLNQWLVGETRFSTPQASLKTSTETIFGTKAGTIAGEGARFIGMYKRFPVEIIHTHLRRYLSMQGGQRGAYLTTFVIGSMLMGALALQTKQMVQGKDPIDMFGENTLKFWAAAFVQGGGAGIFGDFLFSRTNRFGGGLPMTLAGPGAQLASDAWDLFAGNLQDVAFADREGETNFAAEGVKFVGKYTPIASSLFYTRLAYQRLVINQLQLMADPKARQKFRQMESKAEKDYGQKFYWRPGKTSPDRPPELP